MQLVVLSGIDSEKTSVFLIEDSAGGFLVGFKGIVDHQNEAGTYIKMSL
jgi:hypothetical protein